MCGLAYRVYQSVGGEMVIAVLSSRNSGESEEGPSVGVGEGCDSKTLAENPRDKGVLSEGARVSDELNKALDVESGIENVANKTTKESLQSSRQDIGVNADASRSKTGSQRNKWDLWRIMNMVERVLDGKLGMDDEVDGEVEEVYHSENALEVNMVEVNAVNSSDNGCETNVVEMEDVDDSANGLAAIVVEREKDVKTLNNVREACIFEEDLETSRSGHQGNLFELNELIQDGLIEGAGLKGGQDLLCKELVRYGMGLNSDQDTLSNDLGLDLVDLKGGPDFLSNESVPGGSGLKGDHSLYYKLMPALKGDQDALSTKLALDGMGLIEGQYLLSNYLVPHGSLQNGEVNDVEGDTCLVPKTRGEDLITEKEGEFYVSDLVWGKVRCHPWWPGQIFLPTASSDKAKKYYKKSSYLIAYFGDQSFAWNEGSNIKPFHMYFSQMEKQSSSDSFCHAVSCALDEVARRAEFGLSCKCLSEEVCDRLEVQVVSNAGIHEDKNKLDGKDYLLSSASFSPENFMHFLESLATSSQKEIDRLEFTIKKAQLLAFSRWKGRYEVPIFEQYLGLLEDAEAIDDVSSKKRMSFFGDDSPEKRRHLSGDKEFPIIKEKLISALISSGNSISSNVGEKPIKRAARRPVSSGKKIKSGNCNPEVKRRKLLSLTSQIGDGGKNHEELEMVEIIPSGIPTTDVILSKLTLAAKVPIQGFRVMVPEVEFLREFRNSVCLELSSSLNLKMDSVKLEGEQPADSQTAENTFAFEGTNDSYWKDKPKNLNSKAAQVDKPADKVDDNLVVDLGSEESQQMNICPERDIQLLWASRQFRN